MLAYDCRQCGQITVGGYVNEFEEHFCCKECYEKFCDEHHYAVHLDRLKQIPLP